MPLDPFWVKLKQNQNTSVESFKMQQVHSPNYQGETTDNMCTVHVQKGPRAPPPGPPLPSQVSPAGANSRAKDRVMNDRSPALQHSRPAEDARVRQLQYAKLQGSCDSCVFTGCRNVLTCHSSLPQLAKIPYSSVTSSLWLVGFR